MDATPLTLGQEMSGWAAQLAFAEKKLAEALDGLLELALGGTAVGHRAQHAPGVGGARRGEDRRAHRAPVSHRAQQVRGARRARRDRRGERRDARARDRAA